jgi:hypothetical protein
MTHFADRMVEFTGRLKASIDDRGESLARVHQATTDLLGEARSFLETVEAEHHARAEEVNTFLANHREARHEAVGAMRTAHRESLDAMRHDLDETLGAARKARLEAVTEMRVGFETARHAMSADLRDAAKAWHEFARTR